MQQQFMYSLTGKTNSGNPVSVSRFSDKIMLYNQFVNKYPRFKGKVTLTKYKAYSTDGILWFTNYFQDGEEIIETYESSKQIKELIYDYFFIVK